jgi:hypothetical protein
MDIARLEELLQGLAIELQGGDGVWEFVHGGVQMACVTDRQWDRMRVIAPICDADDIDEAIKTTMLEANFHTALDGRYAISDGVVFACFIHPLSSLSEADFEAAVTQVASLAATFGEEYSSGTLVFGRGGVLN